MLIREEDMYKPFQREDWSSGQRVRPDGRGYIKHDTEYTTTGLLNYDSDNDLIAQIVTDGGRYRWEVAECLEVLT